MGKEQFEFQHENFHSLKDQYILCYTFINIAQSQQTFCFFQTVTERIAQNKVM